MPNDFAHDDRDPWDEDIADEARGSALPQSFLPDDAEALQQRLAETEVEWADLAAIHGNFGKYNDERKIKLAEAKLRTLSMDPPAGAQRWTEDLRDSAARTDRLYMNYVDGMIEDAKTFHALDQERARIKAKLQSLTYSPVR